VWLLLRLCLAVILCNKAVTENGTCCSMTLPSLPAVQYCSESSGLLSVFHHSLKCMWRLTRRTAVLPHSLQHCTDCIDKALSIRGQGQHTQRSTPTICACYTLNLQHASTPQPRNVLQDTFQNTNTNSSHNYSIRCYKGSSPPLCMARPQGYKPARC
jgi:hypothetical protein